MQGLRGVCFGSLSKQRGNLGADKLGVVGVPSEVKAGELMVEGSTRLFTCQDTVLDDIHSNERRDAGNWWRVRSLRGEAGVENNATKPRPTLTNPMVGTWWGTARHTWPVRPVLT